VREVSRSASIALELAASLRGALATKRRHDGSGNLLRFVPIDDVTVNRPSTPQP
jgi:hypothetical protein